MEWIKLNFRDYIVSIALFGLFMCTDGFYILNIPPQKEVLGGGEVVLGIGLMLFSFIFLHFSAQEQRGLLEEALERLVDKLR